VAHARAKKWGGHGRPYAAALAVWEFLQMNFKVHFTTSEW